MGLVDIFKTIGILAVYALAIGLVVTFVMYGTPLLQNGMVSLMNWQVEYRYDYYYGFPAPNPFEYCEEKLGGELSAWSNMVNEFNSCRMPDGDITMFKLIDGNAYILGAEGRLVNQGWYFEPHEKKAPIRKQFLGSGK